ncbi:hypothetical protein [Variovorax sp. E3]|uniref:hypothetical protein n=1 Tax=Variovorax sp. E3 TaxID=1914993 RepID=UPI0022B7373F|nr:hypothetical protein [Variovorax sp. E3]
MNSSRDLGTAAAPQQPHQPATGSTTSSSHGSTAARKVMSAPTLSASTEPALRSARAIGL